jgi:hypothetical protein
VLHSANRRTAREQPQPSQRCGEVSPLGRSVASGPGCRQQAALQSLDEIVLRPLRSARGRTTGVFGVLALLATTACLATPVSANRSTVRAGPFIGGLAAGYDDVDGRFSIRIGGMRTSTMSTKIPWWLPGPYSGGRAPRELVVTGRLLSGSARFIQTLHHGGGGIYPSILKPPKVGCWRLTLKAGTTAGSLTMLARPRFQG